MEIGKVIHYFNKAAVAVVRLNEKLSVGDSVKFTYGENEFVQRINSMEINHQKIESADRGEEVAIKVDQPTREGAAVSRAEE